MKHGYLLVIYNSNETDFGVSTYYMTTWQLFYRKAPAIPSQMPDLVGTVSRRNDRLLIVRSAYGVTKPKVCLCSRVSYGAQILSKKSSCIEVEALDSKAADCQSWKSS